MGNLALLGKRRRRDSRTHLEVAKTQSEKKHLSFRAAGTEVYAGATMSPVPGVPQINKVRG